jgi:hypothetical protein
MSSRTPRCKHVTNPLEDENDDTLVLALEGTPGCIGRAVTRRVPEV